MCRGRNRTSICPPGQSASSGSSAETPAVPFTRSRCGISSGAPMANEEQSGARVDPEVAQALEHAVAVVVGPDQEVGRDHADEARIAALKGAVGPALGVGGGEEEEAPP